jgi:Flp pilus assembly protein TadG
MVKRNHIPGLGRCRPRGAAATELALTAPVVVLLALGAMDFGRVAYFAVVVSNASRAGAEAGAIRRFTVETEPLWRSQVRDAVTQEMENLPSFQQSDLATQIVTSSDSNGAVHVAVEVRYPFRTIVSWPGLPTEIPLREHVEYRQFR